MPIHITLNVWRVDAMINYFCVAQNDYFSLQLTFDMMVYSTSSKNQII